MHAGAHVPDAEPIHSATVRTPDGTTFDLDISEWHSTVRVRDIQPSPQPRPVRKQ
jgi:hypothetical protein